MTPAEQGAEAIERLKREVGPAEPAPPPGPPPEPSPEASPQLVQAPEEKHPWEGEWAALGPKPAEKQAENKWPEKPWSQHEWG